MTAIDTPVIIEVALNGATKKSRNPRVPISVDELAADAIACLDAGAHIIHQHDDLGDGAMLGGASPTAMADKAGAFYRQVLASAPDALLYPTSNWPGDIEFRWGHQVHLAESGLIRMAYVDPGSVNIGPLDADGLPQADGSLVYAHSYADIAWMMAQCESLALAPSLAIFEPGFLRVVRAYENAGRMPAGAFVKLYFGDRLPFGFPPTRSALNAYLDLMGDSELPWAVAVLGGDVLASGLARQALEAGGHLRVGLEDYAGEEQPTNLQLLEQAVALCADVGRPVASRDEAKAILGLTA